MVHQTFGASSPIKLRHRTMKLLSLFFLVASVVFLSVYIFSHSNLLTNNYHIPEDTDAFDEDHSKISDLSTDSVSQGSYLPSAVDFQSAIDVFSASSGGQKSVLIYDIERQELVNSYNPDSVYNTASLYKLFVVYEGYRRIDSNEWDQNAMAGATGLSIIDCLDLSIRESNSACAETLWGMIDHTSLDNIIKNDYGIIHSDISRLSSTPEDIMSIMQLFYDHPHISSVELIARVKDSFLNQPVTSYNWRQGLPSGFARANVYNKVGWDYNPNIHNWNVYHDAAIIEFPEENRHFIVVVMTTQTPFQQITNLGSQIEDIFYKSY